MISALVKTIVFTTGAVALVVFCYLFLDRPFASFVQQHIHLNEFWFYVAYFLSNIPVLMFFLSPLFVVRFFYQKYWVNDTNLWQVLLCLASMSLVLSYLITVPLKFIFARTNIQLYLYCHTYEFFWFTKSAYLNAIPSGHVASSTGFLWILCRHAPKYQSLWWPLLFFIPLMVFLLNSHFLGDLLAGAAIGILMAEAVGCVLMKRDPHPLTKFQSDKY